MNRRIRMRRFNDKTQTYDTIFPQTITENVLRADNGAVLEWYLQLYDKHLRYSPMHLNRAVSAGTHRHLTAHIHRKELVDYFPLLLELHTELDFEPTLDFNGTGSKPIINGAGERVPGGQLPGTILFMVYSETKDAWIMLSNDNYNDITRVTTPVEHTHWEVTTADGQQTFVLPGFNRSNMRIREVNYGQTVLIYGKDWDFEYTRLDAIVIKSFETTKGDLLYFIWNSYVTTARKANLKLDIVNKTSNFIVPADNTTEVPLPATTESAIAVDIIYGQTKLREGIDYVMNMDTRTLKLAFPLEKGDLVNIQTTELTETPGDALPNNFGSTGTYRYSVDVVHGEYTADTDNTTIIPVPEFNQRRDKLTLIRENKVLVLDVDYTIDLMDQIVLINNRVLNANDTIYWTILRGAMVDVPNFNVIRASGVSGQHLLVDIDWEQVCDYYVILIKLTQDLLDHPTIKCINGPARPVVDCFGQFVRGGYKAGAYLWVVYNADNDLWYSMSHSQIDITSRIPVVMVEEGDDVFHGYEPDSEYYGAEHTQERVIPHKLGVAPTTIDINPTEPPGMDSNRKPKTIGDIWYYADENNIYVGNTGNATSAFHWRISNTNLVGDLWSYFDTELDKVRKQNPKLTTLVDAIEIDRDDVDYIPIQWWTWDTDMILVNYGQTVLREEIDYTRTSTGIQLKSFTLQKGDVIQYTLVKQDKIADLD